MLGWPMTSAERDCHEGVAFRGDCDQEFANPAAETRNGSLGGLAQKRLQFAEGLLDRIEIRRIFRQVKQPRTGRFNGLLHSDTFVSRQVVDDDDVATLVNATAKMYRLAGAKIHH